MSFATITVSTSEKACCQVSCSSTACDWTTGRKRSHSNSNQPRDKWGVGCHIYGNQWRHRARNKLQQISARKTPISHSQPASRRVGLSTCISNMQPRLHPDRRDYRLAVEAGRYRQRRTDGTMNLSVRPVSSAANRRKTAGRWWCFS